MTRLSTIGLIAASVAIGVARAETRPVRELRAVRGDGSPVTVDGSLTDTAWDSAACCGGFTQRDPDEGQAATESTRVRLFFDSHALYIALECSQRETPIVANEKRRDARLWDDDCVGVCIDTYRDRRNAYVFVVNPAGAMWDAMVRDDGLNVSDDWDGIWDCGTAVTDDGWSAELRIPLDTIRFRRDVCRWGFNVTRLVRRRNELVQWQLIPRSRGGEAMFVVSGYGTLSGMELEPRLRRWEFRPYALGGHESLREETELKRNWVSDVGADVRFKLSSDLAFDLTYNTDFAQVEADESRISLSRFALFYPEKRGFFLESADLFRVGEHHFPWEPPQTELFFSRTIGLDEDGEEEIPLLGGARLTGRRGSYDIGMLAVATEETEITPDDETILVPSAWYAVGRVQRDFLTRSKLGVLVLAKEAEGGHRNRVASADYSLSLGDHVRSSAFAAVSGDSEEGLSAAGSMHWAYSSERVHATTILGAVGDDFVDDMGFVMRTGVYKARLSLSHDRRVRWLGIRDHSAFVNATYVTDTDGAPLTEVGFVGTWVGAESGANAFLGAGSARDELDEEFDLGDGDLVFDMGTYQWYFCDWDCSSDQSRWASVSMSGGFGGFFDARHWSLRAALLLKPSSWLQGSVRYGHNDIRRAQDVYTSNLLAARLSNTLSTKLSNRVLVQWNDDADTLSANFVLRWSYAEGSDIYFVWDQIWPTDGDDEDAERRFLTKITYWLPA
jgi:hypothetical protein